MYFIISLSCAQLSYILPYIFNTTQSFDRIKEKKTVPTNNPQLKQETLINRIHRFWFDSLLRAFNLSLSFTVGPFIQTDLSSGVLSEKCHRKCVYVQFHVLFFHLNILFTTTKAPFSCTQKASIYSQELLHHFQFTMRQLLLELQKAFCFPIAWQIESSEYFNILYCWMQGTKQSI